MIFIVAKYALCTFNHEFKAVHYRMNDQNFERVNSVVGMTGINIYVGPQKIIQGFHVFHKNTFVTSSQMYIVES